MSWQSSSRTREVDGIASRPDGGTLVAGAGHLFCRSEARAGTEPILARTPFTSPEANIVVCSDGYFDVYSTAARTNGDKPAYRGRLAELGPGIRGADDRLAVRPGSAGLIEAVNAWSAVNGAGAAR